MSPPSVTNNNDEDSIRTLRRQVDAVFVERLVRVETAFHEIEKNFDREVIEIKRQMDAQNKILDTLVSANNQLLERQKKSDPILDSLDSLARASTVMKWIIVFLMGAMGAIATVLSIIDYFKKG